MNVIAVPAGNDVPLSGLTVTWISESVQAAPPALDDELGEADVLALAEALGDGDGAAVGAGSDEPERNTTNSTIRTTSPPSPTNRRRRQ